MESKMESPMLLKAEDKNVKSVLNGVKYKIDVFQREYTWEEKHMAQLIDDLTARFLSNYKESHERKAVANYSKYYLGSIVVCLKDGKRSIVDGQQRLTSLTLLLIYLNNLQKDSPHKVNFSELIFSEKYDEKSFNLDVEGRKECLEGIYNNGSYNVVEDDLSVKNIVERYKDIEERFPGELKGKALPYLIDWLTDNVIFVEIITYSNDDAYLIFETMNDRGLNLSYAEMLKGYLISNLSSQEEKIKLNKLWKDRIFKLKKIDDKEDLEFFKAWLRAKYAETIRQGKKGSGNEDFEKIGQKFHSWLRENLTKVKLTNESDFSKFIEKEYDFYVTQYLKINHAADNFSKNLESIYFLEKRSFSRTFYFTLLLAPIKMTDSEADINKKFALVSNFLEMFFVFRSINYRTLGYSSIRYTMFSLVKDIRDKDVQELSNLLKKKAQEFEENLDGIKDLRLNGQNRRFMHFLLARITRYIEERCDVPSTFESYIDPNLKKPFEVEHIWSDKFEEHADEFGQRDEWDEYRNKIGALILLPRGFNQSYGDIAYIKKLPHYFGQNLLAKTLNQKCYERNPTFMKFIEGSGLPFKPHPEFKKKDIQERQRLYQKICEQIYDLGVFERIAREA